MEEQKKFELQLDEPPEKQLRPGLLAWIAAAVILLLALPALGLAAGHAVMAVPAVRGLWYESAGRLYSALDDFEALYEKQKTVEKWSGGLGLAAPRAGAGPGFNATPFLLRHEVYSSCRITGPLLTLAYNQDFDFFALYPRGGPVPFRLRETAKDLEGLSAAHERINEALAGQPELAEGQSRGAWLIEAVNGMRENDAEGVERQNYYDAWLLHYLDKLGGDNEEEILELIGKLKSAKGSAPWMYDYIELPLLCQARDYPAILAVCDLRQKSNKEDLLALEYRIKATYLMGEKDKAHRLADALARHSALGSAARLAKAELLYRDGNYADSIQLCDEIYQDASRLGNAGAPTAVSAVRVKAIALLLSGNAGKAVSELKKMYDKNPEGVDYAFVCASIAAAHTAGDKELAGLAAPALGSQIPLSLTRLAKGEITLETIYLTDWGF
ncbi:MAG: hypothetical protein FWH26_09515 [Oscillospiraceae bacterium]|nr:hypothetical protein [Oscillospiraceae bacterium]